MSQPSFEARIVASARQTPNMLLLGLEAAAGFAPTHIRPGQYAELSLAGDGSGLYAMASAPGEQPIEFLIRRGQGFSDALYGLGTGSRLSLGPALGPGFPLEATRGRDLYLLAAGTGIAALRPVVRCVLRERAAWGRVTLFYGVRFPRHFAFLEELAVWERHDVEVLLVTSGKHSEPFESYTGYVQDLAEERRVPTENAHVFACGGEAMLADVRQTFAALGLEPAHFHTNV